MSEQQERDAAADLTVCAAATPGPWVKNLGRSGFVTTKRVQTGFTDADAEFCALARTALPYWIERAVAAEDALTRRRLSDEAHAAEYDALSDHCHAIESECARLKFFIAQSLPFLVEAWKACFHGQEQAMLSAEERGMGRLLRLFQDVANGNPALPPGVVTAEDADKRVEAAVNWAHQLLGCPNELAPDLAEWMTVGETCADGLRRASARVQELEAEVERLRAKVGE